MTPKPQPVFLHGLESGPHGSKFHTLRTVFPDLIAPDTEGIFDPDERLARIRSVDRRCSWIGGSRPLSAPSPCKKRVTAGKKRRLSARRP